MEERESSAGRAGDAIEPDAPTDADVADAPMASVEAAPPRRRGGVLRDSIGVGLATAAYGISFGALSVAAGLDVWQTCFLSLVMFTGGSQFALVGVLATGGAAAGGSAIATAALLGIRNVVYGMRMAPVVDRGGMARRRIAAAWITIDESTAVALAQTEDRAARSGSGSPGRSSSSAGTSRRSPAPSSAMRSATREPGAWMPRRRPPSSGCCGRA